LAVICRSSISNKKEKKLLPVNSQHVICYVDCRERLVFTTALYQKNGFLTELTGLLVTDGHSLHYGIQAPTRYTRYATFRHNVNLTLYVITTCFQWVTKLLQMTHTQHVDGMAYKTQSSNQKRSLPQRDGTNKTEETHVLTYRALSVCVCVCEIVSTVNAVCYALPHFSLRIQTCTSLWSPYGIGQTIIFFCNCFNRHFPGNLGWLHMNQKTASEDKWHRDDLPSPSQWCQTTEENSCTVHRP